MSGTDLKGRYLLKNQSPLSSREIESVHADNEEISCTFCGGVGKRYAMVTLEGSLIHQKHLSGPPRIHMPEAIVEPKRKINYLGVVLRKKSI